MTIPKANYIAVRGAGDPNEEDEAYKKAIGVLYAVAYTLKMSYETDYKIRGLYEYVVPPLEGFWWQSGIDEGLCVQVMHIGSFDEEPETEKRMDAFIEAQGYDNPASNPKEGVITGSIAGKNDKSFLFRNRGVYKDGY